MVCYTYYNKEKVTLADEPLASGGEGEIRKVEKCPSRFTDVCAKIYFEQGKNKDQEQKIRFMVENPPSSIIANGMMLAWPLETLYDNRGSFLGFIMPTAFANSKKLVILTLPTIKKAYKDEWYKFDKSLDVKTALVSRLMLIKNIAIPIHKLHATGKYVLKDFKPDNVLVTPQGKITIVDMDSIQICENGKLLFPGTAATADYMPPEFYTDKVGVDKSEPLDTSWDNFAVSEVFYQLLFGLKPYAVMPKSDDEDSNTIPYCIAHNLFPFGKNASLIAKVPAPHENFRIIPQTVKDLFIRAFGDNPKDRPQAQEWGSTINAELKSMPNVHTKTHADLAREEDKHRQEMMRLLEEERKKVEEERRKAEEERLRAEEERRKAEEERQKRLEEERQRKAEEARLRKLRREEKFRKLKEKIKSIHFVVVKSPQEPEPDSQEPNEEDLRKKVEQQVRKEYEERMRVEIEERLRKEEEERQRKEEEERQRKEEEERQRKEEEERQRKEEEERQRKEEEERQRKEEEERQRKEEEERQRKEEEERQRKEEEERQRKEEEERQRKEEEERQRKEEEERQRKEEEERQRKEEEERQQLSASRFCHKCGNRVSAEARFCNKCGTKLNRFL